MAPVVSKLEWDQIRQGMGDLSTRASPQNCPGKLCWENFIKIQIVGNWMISVIVFKVFSLKHVKKEKELGLHVEGYFQHLIFFFFFFFVKPDIYRKPFFEQLM